MKSLPCKSGINGSSLNSPTENCVGPVEVCCGITYGKPVPNTKGLKLGEVKVILLNDESPRVNCLNTISFGSSVLAMYIRPLSNPLSISVFKFPIEN